MSFFIASNPRLQRTRSAPLRSPLSRKPLGAGRVPVALSAVALTAFAMAGCNTGPSLKEYRSRLAKTSGDGAVDCGLIRLGSSRVRAVSCVRSALTAHRPVFVAFQVIGMDSEFFRGLAVNKDGRAVELRWDGDVWGGSHFAKESRVDERPCSQPSVLDDESPIHCQPAGV